MLLRYFSHRTSSRGHLQGRGCRQRPPPNVRGAAVIPVEGAPPVLLPPAPRHMAVFREGDASPQLVPRPLSLATSTRPGVSRRATGEGGAAPLAIPPLASTCVRRQGGIGRLCPAMVRGGAAGRRRSPYRASEGGGPLYLVRGGASSRGRRRGRGVLADRQAAPRCAAVADTWGGGAAGGSPAGRSRATLLPAILPPFPSVDSRAAADRGGVGR